MIHHPDQLVAWLRTAARGKDRVLVNAIDTGGAKIETITSGWRICITSRRGIEYRVIIVADPVGLPIRYHHEKKTPTVSESD